MPPILSEDDYLKAIVSGDRDGIDLIYNRYLNRIVKHITSNGGSFDDACDVFQDAMIILYEKGKSGKLKLSSSFYTLLHGICRNIWGNRLQKKSFKEVTLIPGIKYSSGENLEGDLLKEEEEQLFWGAFQKLDEKCRELLKLFFEKVKMKEIMEKMGFGSVNYTKKRKFLCKEKLIELLNEDQRFQELQNH